MNLLADTQKKIERESKKLMAMMKLKSYRELIVNFIVVTVCLFIVIIYFTLAQAKIIITPNVEEATYRLQVPIAELDGQAVETEVSASEIFTPREGQLTETQAEGKIILYNKTADRQQILVATSQLVNETGEIIRLKDKIILSPSQKAEVEAYADKAGTAGEVEPGRFQVLKLPYLKDKIYGEVEKKFSGGEREIKVVTDDDLAKAKEKVKVELKRLAQEKLKTEEVIVNINKLSASAKSGDTNVDNFTVTATASAQAVLYNTDNARNLIKQDLAVNLPANKVIKEFLDNSFHGTLTPDGTKLDLVITVRLEPKIAVAAMEKKNFIGLNQEEVRQYFAKITGVKAVEVQFSPFWVKSVPRLQEHIKIEIKNN